MSCELYVIPFKVKISFCDTVICNLFVLFYLVDWFCHLCEQAYSGVNRYVSASGSGPSSSHSPGQSLALDQLSKTNLYIRGLQPNTTDRDLVNLCQGWVTAIFG